MKLVDAGNATKPPEREGETDNLEAVSVVCAASPKERQQIQESCRHSTGSKTGGKFRGIRAHVGVSCSDLSGGVLR